MARSSYSLPVVLSVVLHLGLLAAVTWGFASASDTKRTYTPKYVEAKLVKLKAEAPKKVAPKKPKPKKVDLTKKRREEAARKKRAEAEAKRKALAKQKALDKARAEKLKKEAAKREAEALAKEKARLAALEKQKQLEREQAQDEFFSELEEEDEFLLAEENEQIAQSYVSKISSRIEQNWSRPPSARTGMKCELRLTLVPTGKVVNVSIVKSSGNAAFDRSAELAVQKAERFPELQGMDPQIFERYFRQLTLVFNPQDLRL